MFLGKKADSSGGIRTHVPEETDALNQHLRPLGHVHATVHAFTSYLEYNFTKQPAGRIKEGTEVCLCCCTKRKNKNKKIEQSRSNKPCILVISSFFTES